MGLFSKSTPTAKAIPPAPNTNSDGSEIVPPPPIPEGLSSTVKANVPKPTAPLNERQLYFQQLRVRIHQQLVERLDVQNLRSLPPETVRSEVRVLIRELCQSEKGLINSIEQEKLMDEVMDETFGLDPLETLLKDPAITDILVNKYDRIYCVK